MDGIRGSKFKSGFYLCWTSLLVLPVGLLAIGGGPCAGPRNSLGSAILLTVGVCSVATAVSGAIRVLTSISAVQNLMGCGVPSLSAARASALSWGVSIFSLDSSRYEASSDIEIFTVKFDHRLNTQHFHIFVA